MNPYDKYVKKMHKKRTILWHVDNLNISHMYPKVVGNIINMLNEKYREEAPITVTRGKVYEYLVMTMDFSTIGKVVIQM